MLYHKYDENFKTHLYRDKVEGSRPIEVLMSGAGYYLGTLDEDGSPYSRVSDRYWRTGDEAQLALDNENFPVKPHP